MGAIPKADGAVEVCPLAGWLREPMGLSTGPREEAPLSRIKTEGGVAGLRPGSWGRDSE